MILHRINVILLCLLTLSVVHQLKIEANNTTHAQENNRINVTIDIDKNNESDWHEVVHSFCNSWLSLHGHQGAQEQRLDNLNRATKCAMQKGCATSIRIEYVTNNEEGDEEDEIECDNPEVPDGDPFLDSAKLANEQNHIHVSIEIDKKDEADWEKIVSSFSDIIDTLYNQQGAQEKRLDKINRATKYAMKKRCSTAVGICI